jgi:hypothetical protein
MHASFLHPGAGCRRARLPGWLRLAITFSVLFALKYTLPFLGIAPAGQIFLLLLVATALAWQFWWHCSPDRRGVLALISVLWIAGVIKLLRL